MLEINKIYQGDCLEIMKFIDDNSVDAIVTDPPYELGFMGKSWDKSGIAYNINMWKECLRVLKPGGYLLSFGGTRTYHRMACAIEDAGWIIKDCIMWLYGSGFPKSYNIGKAVDKKLGNERVPYIRPDFVARSNKTEQRNSQVPCGEKGKYTKGSSEWEGWGTALKPAYEPIIMAMKPNEGTYAENALKWGVAGLNIDSGRIDYKGEKPNLGGRPQHTRGDEYGFKAQKEEAIANTNGRFPANLILDEEAAKLLDEQSGEVKGWKGQYHNKFNPYGGNALLKSKTTRKGYHQGFNDKGGASRFFYCAKASKSERGKDNNHPCVKPIKLLEYLIKLVSREGALILDPFTGSGSTLIACKKVKRNFIGIELNPEYVDMANKRIKAIPETLF